MEGKKRSKREIIVELDETKNQFCKWLKELQQENPKFILMVEELRSKAYSLARLSDELFNC